MRKEELIATAFILGILGAGIFLLLHLALYQPAPVNIRNLSNPVYTPKLYGATTSACLPPDIQVQLDTAWANHSTLMAEEFRKELSGGDPTGLYNMQQYTNNLLDQAVTCHNPVRFNQIIALYNISYQFLTVTPQGYDEWICDKTCPDSTNQGKEIALDSLQFLYVVSRSVHIISAIDKPNRTPEMNTFVANFGPLAVESYTRWQPLFLASEELKMDVDLHQINAEYAIGDEDLWLSAGMVELLAANQNDPAIAISDKQRMAMVKYINLTNELVRSRITETNLTDFNGTPVKGIIIDYGELQIDTDNRFACYSGTSFPVPDQLCTAKTGLDISHGRRFVEVFQTLHDNRNITGSEFPDDEFIVLMANELVYGSSNRNTTKPLFTNYFGGMNGWYRVGYDGPGLGYPPYGLTSSVPLGGYGYWASYNGDVGRLMHSLLNLSETHDQFIKKYYPELQTDLGKIEFLPTFARDN